MSHGRSWLILFLLMASVYAVAQPPKAPPVAVNDEDELSAEEQRERTIMERFRSILEKNPRRGTALDRVYSYHVERGTLPKLIADYRERVKKAPTDGTAWLLVGLFETLRGKDADAVPAFHEAEKHLPNNPIPSYYLGQAYVLLGQPDAAAEAFERAIDRKPPRTELLEIFSALGRVHQRAQRPDKALVVWNRLEKLYPDDERVQEQIAATLVEESQFKEALPRLQKLADRADDPHRKTTLRMEIADLKVRLKQRPEALADFEKLLSELNPDSWLYREVRRKVEEVFTRNDDQAGLSKYYEEWIAKNPSDIEAYSRLARSLASQGRSPEARQWLEKALPLAPKRRDLRQTLVELLVAEQKFPEALAQYEEMDKADPNNPDILREWGKLAFKDTTKTDAARQQAAADIWRKLVARKPKDPLVAANVADLMRQAGLNEAALELYRKAVELAPDQPQYREYLGEFLHTLKRSEEALAAWRPIAEGANRNAKNLARLAEVLAGFNYRKEAVAAFEDALKLEKEDFNLLVRYAELLSNDNRHEDALKQLAAAEKLTANDDERDQIIAEQIKVYQATDSLNARIAELRKELSGGQDGTAARWYRLAKYHENNRQYPEAIEAISQAVKLDPKAVNVLSSAARIQEQGGSLLDAADTYRKLAVVDRRFRTDHLTNVAKLEARLGRRAEALKAGRDLLASAPGNPDVYKFYAELCDQLGESEEALEAMRRSVRANPSDPNGLITLANGLAERYQTGEAIELLWRAFEKAEDLDSKLMVIGRLSDLHSQLNQLDKLIDRLKRDQRESEKRREATMCLAAVYQSASDLGSARQQLERLLADNARDTALLAQLSNLAEQDSDLASALRFQRELIKASPNNRDALLRLAQLQVRLGEFEEAAAIWVQLVAEEPEPHRNLQAIDQLTAYGKHEAVLRITSKLLARRPNDWELLSREAIALVNLKRPAEATERFQQILALKLPDDTPSAKWLAQLKSRKAGRAGWQIQSFSGQVYDRDRPLVESRINSWEIQGALGFNPSYTRYYQQQRQAWGPQDYGQARAAALLWAKFQARREKREDEFLASARKAAMTGEPRALMDYVYLNDFDGRTSKDNWPLIQLLGKIDNPESQFLHLKLLPMRNPLQAVHWRYARFGDSEATDRMPPLPEAELANVLKTYERLKATKPDWITPDIITNLMTELRRAKKSDEEARIYRDAQDTAKRPASILQMLFLAAHRGDKVNTLKLFDKLAKTQSQSSGTPLPTAQAVYGLSKLMGQRAKQKAFAELPEIVEVYLTEYRKQRQTSLASLTKTHKPQQVSYDAVAGRFQGQTRILDFPMTSEYFDSGCIGLLRVAFDLYLTEDIVSDLLAFYRKRLATAAEGEKIEYQLILGYLAWWNEDRGQALDEFTKALNLAPQDHNLRLMLAQQRERNNQPAEALSLLDAVTPLDQSILQQCETMALRLAEQLGNPERARKAAERLFGLRLDTDAQTALAEQMHRLGMHAEAEAVMARAQRSAGNRIGSLSRLMMAYQVQGKAEQAVQIARQLLRRSPTPNENDGSRSQAIAVLNKSGQLKELIERTEAQLKASPRSLQLHQQLMEYYSAANQQDKAKEISKALLKLKPEDAHLRLEMARRMQQNGDLNLATEFYGEALKLDAKVAQNYFWEIRQAFDQARKEKEFQTLLETIDLRGFTGNSWQIGQFIREFVETDQVPRALKLLARAWDAFEDERIYLIGSLDQEKIWNAPVMAGYLRQLLLPEKGRPFDPWLGMDQSFMFFRNDFRPGAITKLLELTRLNGRSHELLAEVEAKLKEFPRWSAGQALRAILLMDQGHVTESRKIWETLLADKEHPMPPDAGILLGRELESRAAFQDLLLKIYEQATDQMLESGDRDFSTTPVIPLVRLYTELGRKDDAFKLLLRVAEGSDHPYDPGYAAYRKIQNVLQVASELEILGRRITGIRLLSDLHNDRSLVDALTFWSGNHFLQQLTNRLQELVNRSITDRELPDAINDLLAIREDVDTKGKPALDLLTTIDGNSPQQYRMNCLFERILTEATQKPELLTNTRKRLDELTTKHPENATVLVARGLLAVAEKKPEQLSETLRVMSAYLDKNPLEALPENTRPNSRQRQQAELQMWFWLVARTGLKDEKSREIATPIGERALAAARRHLDNRFTLAILREWAMIDLERGDMKSAERRFTQMLEVTLPRPVKPAGSGQAPRLSRPLSRLAAIAIGQIKAVPVSPATPATPVAVPVVGTISTQQFAQAMEVASLATDHGMVDLAIRAVREALAGGPPSTAQNESKNPARSRISSGDPSRGSFTNVAGMLNPLIQKWRKLDVPANKIYGLLADVVLPPSRPNEVFPYAGRPKAVREHLVDYAVKTQKIDDLKARLATRLKQPLGELPARQILLMAALRANDESLAKEQLTWAAERLQKDKIRTTTEQIHMLARECLDKPRLAPVARGVLLSAAKNFLAAQDEVAASEVYMQLARHHFDLKQPEESNRWIKEVLAIAERSIGKDNVTESVNRTVIVEYARQGQVEAVMALLGPILDRQTTKPESQPGVLYSDVIEPLARQLLARPAPERYAILKEWTLPDGPKPLIRVQTRFLKENAPPEPFGQFRPLPEVVCTAKMLVDAAKETGQLAVLEAEVVKLDPKTDHAQPLLMLIHLAQGKPEPIKSWLKQRTDFYRKIQGKPSEDDTGKMVGSMMVKGQPSRPTVYGAFDFVVAHAAFDVPSLRDDVSTFLDALGQRNNHIYTPLMAGRRQEAQLGAKPEMAGGVVGMSPSQPVNSWMAEDGMLMPIGTMSTLLVDYPLLGSFTVEVEAFSGQLVYGGMPFPRVGKTGRFRNVDNLNALRSNDFQTHRLVVEPNGVKHFVNDKLVREEKEIALGSPWLGFAGLSDSAYRNLRLIGKPEIPRSVNLIAGDRLLGWASNGQVAVNPPSEVKPQPGQPLPQVYAPDYDWYVQAGELRGRNDPDLRGRALSYLRTSRGFREGETFRYEWFHEPGQSEAHAVCGRIVFLIMPDGLQLHYINPEPWTNLAADHAIPAQGAKPYQLKVKDWNAAELTFRGNRLSLKVNGGGVYEMPYLPNTLREFGVAHFKDKTGLRVRNVTLSGDWPTEPKFAIESTTPDRVGLRRQLIAHNLVPLSARELLKQLNGRPAAERYARLAAWVLPAAPGGSYRLHGYWTPLDVPPPRWVGDYPQGSRILLGSQPTWPVVELFAAAKQAGKLDDLAAKIQAIGDKDLRAARAISVLLALARDQEAESITALKALGQACRAEDANAQTPVTNELMVARQTEAKSPAIRLAAMEMLHSLKPKEWNQNQQRSAQIATALGRLAVANSPTPRPFGSHPNLRNWAIIPRNIEKRESPEATWGHWDIRDGTVQYYAASHNSSLVFRSPLTGDFEITTELRRDNPHFMSISFAGYRIQIASDRTSWLLLRHDKEIRQGQLAKLTPNDDEWIPFKIACRGETLHFYWSGQEVTSQGLSGNPDRWLILIPSNAGSSALRNLKINGNPIVIKELRIDGLTEFGDSAPHSGWFKQGEETRSRRLRLGQYDYEFQPSFPPTKETWSPAYAYYHRPLVEDGEWEYEFYYEPGEFLAHPSLDRLVMYLTPTGVREHWRNERGVHDRQPYNNMADEPKYRRAERLPLTPKAWNQAKLTVIGDSLKLSINGVLVYERPIESTNLRNFGVFNSISETAGRVRGLVYRGAWLQELTADLWQ